MSASKSVPSVDVRVLVLSGPSGSGKSTVVDRLIADAPVKLVKAISATTRPARAGEVHGQDYYFLSPEEFETRRQAGDFVECEVQVHGNGNWYGTLRTELGTSPASRRLGAVRNRCQGALSIIEEYPDAVSVFLGTASEAGI